LINQPQPIGESALETPRKEKRPNFFKNRARSNRLF
jgi:hypothetical protein